MNLKKLLHWSIYANFLVSMLYAAVKVFTTPRAEFFLRRLYAFEFWIIFGFFSIYFALTVYNHK